MKRVAVIFALCLTLPVAACVSAQKSAGTAPGATPAAESAPGSEYDALIARYAEENGVPVELAHAVIELESGYNARATGRGTIGLMQIKPATAAGIGYRGPAAGLYDPATNLEWGMKYLGGAYELGGGDICGTALRYQGGHRATRATASTNRYCASLKALMAEGGGG
jgi:soluble lytic murein transglycosylase-like protein